MAGGGAKASKKAEKKKKEKIIEDRTFGLKNKNKSKVVQKYVNMVEKTVKNPNGHDSADARKKAKEEKKAQEAEINALFKDVEADKKKKKKSAWDDLKGNKKEQNESSLEDLEEEEEDIPEIVLVENNDQLRDLENEIDAERAALPSGGTPLTLERFLAWKEKRKKQRERQRIKDGKVKKKFTTGKMLFLENAKIFVDDDKADVERYKKPVDEDDANAYHITDKTFKEIDPEEYKKMREKQKAEAAAKKAEEEKKAATTSKPAGDEVKVDTALFAQAADDDLDALLEE